MTYSDPIRLCFKMYWVLLAVIFSDISFFHGCINPVPPLHFLLGGN